MEEEIRIKEIHLVTKVEDRALSAVGKEDCKGLVEIASQEVERKIMIRGIPLLTKVEDRALSVVGKGE